MDCSVLYWVNREPGQLLEYRTEDLQLLSQMQKSGFLMTVSNSEVRCGCSSQCGMEQLVTKLITGVQCFHWLKIIMGKSLE